MAVSDREKNADNAKKASRGKNRSVTIKKTGLGHGNFAARFGDGFLDPVLYFQFRLIHDGRELGNEKEASTVQHPLLAERQWFNPAEMHQVFKDLGHMENRTGAHFLRVFLEAVFPVFLSEKLITAKEGNQLLDIAAIYNLAEPNVAGIRGGDHDQDVVGTNP
jgi:hypothetical protein